MIRTRKFALRQDPANSQAIVCHATQQNAAHNIAVDGLSKGSTPTKGHGLKVATGQKPGG